jgi:KaiC/GvpD/RAD55 family RecA-like ATPase
LIASESNPDHEGPESSVVHAKSSVTTNLLLEFLEVPGNVLLIQGAPGTGKTSLALELLNAMRDSHRVYASIRVSPIKLRKEFPWIDEVIDSMSGRSSKAKSDEFYDLRGSDTDSVLAKVIRLKQAKQKSVLVVDSWAGALRNTTPEGCRMLESAVLSELDQTKVSVILVSEAEKEDSLGYLVDGVVTLEHSKLDGRRMRSLQVDKLRGFQSREPVLSILSGKGQVYVHERGVRRRAADHTEESRGGLAHANPLFYGEYGARPFTRRRR